MWPFKTKQPPIYPNQQLTEQQQVILNQMDDYLIEHRTEMGPNLSIRMFKLGILDQFRRVRFEPEVDGYYIPRTIALVVDNDGTWCFYYGIRNNDPPNPLANELFTACLHRTNEARQ